VTDSQPVLAVSGVDKNFTMHLQGGQHLPVLHELAFEVYAGECVALGGPSGAGKSSILKMVYGNYAVNRGTIVVRSAGRKQGADGTVDVATAEPRAVLTARRDIMGYVSQFLHCVPRVGARHIVAEPLLERGVPAAEANERATELLTRLNIPQRLSGGEQQRVNIARGFITDLPLLLLDEPTASLDARNRDVVTELIHAKRANGTAILGIFHDVEVREAVADRIVDVERFAAAAGAVAAAPVGASA
jgi:alpha-D-ribose 1-methylphosphonate 5-triphosphate synthase subunit PhnL